MSKPKSISLPVARITASPDARGPAARTCDPAQPHPDEFARSSSAAPNEFSRRNFLTYSSAALALAGLTGCSDRPREAIVPYVDPPEQVTPGEPQFFATTLTRSGYGRGVIVTTREGRPIKIEGNPDHPASLGAADAQMQAAVLDLYDPLRSNTVTHAGRPSTWGAFQAALQKQLATHQDDRGEGFYILTDPFTSPTAGSLLRDLQKQFPKLTVLSFDPLDPGTAFLSDENGIEPDGWTMRYRWYGRVYDFAAADVVVSFASDFLTEEPGSLAYARQFIDRRRVSGNRPEMNRLYTTESDFSITGMTSDHRLPARPVRVMQLARAVAAQLGVPGVEQRTDLTPAEARWVAAVSTDLSRAKGRSIVIAGPGLPLHAHEVASKINSFLGNFGKTIRMIASPLSSRPPMFSRAGLHVSSMERLYEELAKSRVRTLLVLADNPVRCAPGDQRIEKDVAQLSQKPDAFVAHLGRYANETAFVSRWHVPMQHELEQWGDARAYDGTASIIQPLIAPQSSSRSVIDLLNAVLGRSNTSTYESVRAYWQKNRTAAQSTDFETWWADTLKRGVVAETAYPALKTKIFREIFDGEQDREKGLSLVIRPDPTILDGKGFHNPWLQELPKPLTKLVWGNAALLSPATMARQGLVDGDVILLKSSGGGVEFPVLGVPGIADDTVVVHTGYGSHRVVNADPESSNRPFGGDAYPLQSGTNPGFARDLQITKTDKRVDLVRTHNHHSMAADAGGDPSVRPGLRPNVIATPDTPADQLKLHNRKLIRTATLAQYARKPSFASDMDEKEIKQLYPAWDYSHGPQWGMTIDLTACIGCNACIVACQAENNIPSVGPEEVAREREMHWLRVDQYLDDAGRAHHQPVPCMHCENAPCEYVCPVAATTHNTEGLNQMTYNRCVGTRYCSNNCPYKVRRFNFFNYTAPTPERYNMQRNPDVTVRTRGVMEKCTYCVQRIVYADRKAEIASLNVGDDRETVRRDLISRLQTACQQTCPTSAIHFGDLTNPTAPVTQQKQSPRNYGILTELSTKPRTTYLASITNPSPMMEGGPA